MIATFRHWVLLVYRILKDAILDVAA